MLSEATHFAPTVEASPLFCDSLITLQLLNSLERSSKLFEPRQIQVVAVWIISGIEQVTSTCACVNTWNTDIRKDLNEPHKSAGHCVITGTQ